VTPAGVPAAADGLSAGAGDGYAVLSFTAPPANGSPIDRYTVILSPGGERRVYEAGSPIVLGGLVNGTAYRFAVVVTNGIGDGERSVASAAVTPSAPTVPVIAPTPYAVWVPYPVPTPTPQAPLPRLGSKRATVSRAGLAQVEVDCTDVEGPCRGNVSLFARGAQARAAGTMSAGSGRAAFALPGGTSRTITVRLAPAMRRSVTRVGLLWTVVRIQPKGSAQGTYDSLRLDRAKRPATARRSPAGAKMGNR
jgi:hypothetical protein